MDIQVIDFQSKEAPKAFTDSLKHTGFAVLTNHPIEDGLIEEVYEEWREFLKYLDEEMEEKDSNTTSTQDSSTTTPSAGEGSSTPEEGNQDDAPASVNSVSARGVSYASTTDQSPTANELALKLGKAANGKDGVKPSGITEPMFNRRDFKKNLTQAEKEYLVDKYLFSDKNQDGYFPQKTSELAQGAKAKDLKHYYHIYNRPEADKDITEMKDKTGRYPEEVSQRAKILGKRMTALGKKLVRWIDEHMSEEIRMKLPEHMRPKFISEVEKDAKRRKIDNYANTESVDGENTTGGLSDCISDEMTLFRILHYPAYKKGDEEPGAVRAGAHTDINCITVLPAGSSRGLQVQSKVSKEWYEVPCIKGSLIINIGDMLQEATQKEYISTVHRVVKPESGEGSDPSVDRLSCPCFIHFKKETYLNEKYATSWDFLCERLRELGVLK